jgi:hypothetical protein
MNTANDEIDKLLGKTFQKAGLRHPSAEFVMKVMERVERIPVKQKTPVDWELWGSIVSIVGSLAVVVAIFPGFFSRIFGQIQFENFLGKFLVNFQNLGYSELFSGSDFLIAVTSLFSIASLILLDKVFSRFHKTGFFFLTA